MPIFAHTGGLCITNWSRAESLSCLHAQEPASGEAEDPGHILITGHVCTCKVNGKLQGLISSGQTGYLRPISRDLGGR